MYEREGIKPMAESEKNQVIRYGILVLESLESDLSEEEKKEMSEILKSLNLTHGEIIQQFETALLT